MNFQHTKPFFCLEFPKEFLYFIIIIHLLLTKLTRNCIVVIQYNVLNIIVTYDDATNNNVKILKSR